jgi:hypothetical protein
MMRRDARKTAVIMGERKGIGANVADTLTCPASIAMIVDMALWMWTACLPNGFNRISIKTVMLQF